MPARWATATDGGCRQQMPSLAMDRGWTTGMRLDERRDGGTTVVAVTGEIDYDTAPVLHERLLAALAAGATALVVDLSGTDFLDSSALGVLVGVDKTIRATGATTGLTIVCPVPQVRRVFALSRLDEVLDIVDTP